MKQEAKSIVKKTLKVACITCVTLGGAALIASGAALKALTEGAKYLGDTVKKIVGEESGTIVDADVAEEPAETPAAEPSADEAVEDEAADEPAGASEHTEH